MKREKCLRRCEKFCKEIYFIERESGGRSITSINRVRFRKETTTNEC